MNRIKYKLKGKDLSKMFLSISSASIWETEELIGREN
jgi:hypothetical protein